MTVRKPMSECPKDDTLRLIWFGKRSVPYVCLYMDQYVAPDGHHGWWSVDPRTGGMSPEWSDPREWQEIASETIVHEAKVNCPVCDTPGMVCEPDRDEPRFTEIRCTNTCCLSNIPRQPVRNGTDWIDCPLCEGDDVPCTTTEAGSLIRCVNYSCPSNVLKADTPC